MSECFATFTGAGGYDSEKERASKVFQVGEKYLITGGTIYDWHTDINIKDIPGNWNSCLFDFDMDAAPLNRVPRYIQL